MKSRWIAGLVFVAVLCSQANAGWIIKEVAGDPEYGEQSPQTIYIQENWFKIVDSSSVTIFDIVNGKLAIVIPETKSYWSGTVDEFRQETKEAMKRQMEESLKNMPPEQRDAYKSMMEEMDRAAEKDVPDDEKTVSVKKASEKTTIAGFASQKYDVYVDEDLVESIWICEDVQIGKEIDIDAFEHFMKTMSGPGREWSFETSSEYVDLLKQGYPMRSVELNEWGESGRMEVVEAIKKAIPQTEFQIPKEYKKISAAELMQQQMMMDDGYDEEEEYEEEEYDEGDEG